MALISFPLSIPTISFSPLTFTKQPVRSHVSRSRPATMCTTEAGKLIEQTTITLEKLHDQTPIRRSGNYKPSTWEFNHMQSLNNPYAGDLYVRRSDELKEIVREMLEEDDQKEPLNLLELIDDLQRLGLSYHFESQIKQVLITIFHKYNSTLQTKEDDLYAKSLIFRLFRQHGFNISQEFFDCFKDEKGAFKPSLCEDTKGMLNLYEASYFLVEGESTLEMAREFTAEHLKKSLDENKIDDNLAALVYHALELPLHWRTTRLEARWFIDIYEKKADTNPLLLKLAKLDFNFVQAKYQEDLKYVTGWWKESGITEKLTYARDTVVPSFLWAVGMIDEPQYGYARRMSTKVNALVTMLDDTYDVYGTVDELQLFTDAVERWDTNAMEQLPYYLKVCFLVLYNTVNEMAYDALREHGIDTIPYLKKLWGDLCKAYLQEAKWYASGYKPTLEEYMNNAWLSISAPVLLAHAYMVVANPTEREVLEGIYNYHDIVRWSAMILRFADDLGTCSDEMQRGDVPKSVQCYMIETGASEEEAREHVGYLIRETWKRMNKDRVANSPFSEKFIRIAVNLGRIAQCVYEFGDGHGNVNSITRHRISSLFFEPIPVE